MAEDGHAAPAGAGNAADALEAAIIEAIEHALALAEAARDAADMAVVTLLQLAELAAERGALGENSGAVLRDALEVATLEAGTTGKPVDEWLREAILAHSDREAATRGDGANDQRERALRARREALRLQGESRAVQAQSAQVAARSRRRRDGGDPGSDRS
jgi:hypothetical protein